MRRDLYVIEARMPDGMLDLRGLQPYEVFGIGALRGISKDQMAKVIWRHCPDAVLTGDTVPLWPRYLNRQWTARPKTW